MKYECLENDCYNLYTINTDKFKTCHLEIILRNKFNKESVTYLALLFDVLTENNASFKNQMLLKREKEKLYNTEIYAVNSRVGNTIITNLICDYLEQKYMEKNLTEDIIKLLFDILFNPNICVDEFDEETFNICKKRLLCEIESVKEDAKQLSILNALNHLNSNSPAAISASGDENILKEITPRKLYKYYLEILEHSAIDIYYIGSTDHKVINNYIKKYSSFTSITAKECNLYLNETSIKKAITIKETNSNTQTNTVLIYSLNSLTNNEINYVMPVFNLLWGSGSLESKLYKSLRGNNSLCYNVNTFYQKYDRLLIVHTAIDKENYSRTVKLIKEELTEMQKGNITKEELNNVLNMLTNSLNLIYDSSNRLIDNYLFTNLVNLPCIDKRIDEFKKVTIDNLISLSKKIKLVLTYRIGD